MKARRHSSLARHVLGMLAVSLLAAPTAGHAWTCTPVSDDLDTTTTLTQVDPIERLAAGIVSGDFCRDLEWQAEEEGITLEESIEKYAWQGPFGYLVNIIREKYPEEFAGSWIEDDVNGFVSFTGTAPPEAVEAIRAFPHPHPIQIIENRGFTQAVLTERLHVVHDIAASYEEVADIVSTYSITTGQIEVTIAVHDSIDTPAKKAELLDRIRAEIPAGRDGTTDDIDLFAVNIIEMIGGGPEPALPDAKRDQEYIYLEETIETDTWQWSLLTMVQFDLRYEYPDDFAGVRIEDDQTVWIAFAGKAPAGAVETILAFPRDIQILENRGFTEYHLKERLSTVHDIVWYNENVTSTVSTFDITTGQITVEFVLDDSIDTPAKKAELLDRIRGKIPAGRDGTIDDIDLVVINPLMHRLEMWMNLEGGSKADRGIDPQALLLLVYLAAAALFLAPFLLYETLATAALGRTIGKKLTRIQTIHTAGGQPPRWTRTTTRWAALHLPLLIPLAGIPIFLLTAASPLFDRQRRGWHDKITGTTVTTAPAGRPNRSNTRPPAKTSRRLAARLIDWTISAAAGLALTLLTLWLLGLEGHLY